MATLGHGASMAASMIGPQDNRQAAPMRTPYLAADNAPAVPPP